MKHGINYTGYKFVQSKAKCDPKQNNKNKFKLHPLVKNNRTNKIHKTQITIG